MKCKIEINSTERTCIVSALMNYGYPELANTIYQRFMQVDTANDGPEVGILCEGVTEHV